MQDCIESHHQAYIHAYNNKYNNILILEDDFIFTNKIKEKKHLHNINMFLKKFIDSNFTYFLGVLPHFVTPYNKYTYNLHLFAGAHGYIISKKCRNIFLLNNKNQPMSHLYSLESFLISNADYAFMYYIPLVYQLCPITDSMKSWGKKGKNIIDYIYNIGTWIFIKSLLFFKLDKQINPGYPIHYFFAKSYFYIIILIIAIIIYYLIL